MAEYQFDREAYEKLLVCSKKKDFSEWNTWRLQHKGRLLLEKADLTGLWLREANLSGAHLSQAKLEKADLMRANLNRAFLENARLKGCHLYRADCRDAVLTGANLQGANMIEASLQGARLNYARLNAVNLHHAALEGADFSYAIVDGETLLDTDQIDRNTLFISVGLGEARVKPGLADSLNYNIRRRRWQEWYDQGNWFIRWLKKGLVQPFWLISDYGRSTARILLVFLSLVALFSVLYGINPGMIHGLEEEGRILKPYRIVYFATATMVTLGFGDMNAHPGSFWGNTLVSLQVMAGYLILAALVTRISVLFSAGGPALALRKTRKKFS